MTTWAWEGQEVAEKEVAVLEAVATETSGSEEGGEDECALSMTKKRDCQGVKEIANSRGVRGLCLTDAEPNFRGLGVYVPRSVNWHPA